MDVSPTSSPPHDLSTGRTTNSTALFIAEVLAGCAAAILAVAVVCCLCSGAARRRTRSNIDFLPDALLARTDEEMLEAGRRTPDAAPVYSTSSPLGPLSPEVVDAISQVSAERRHSLVVSILSSARSLQFFQDSGSARIRVNSGQHSFISSTAGRDSPPPLLRPASLYSSGVISPRLSFTGDPEREELPIVNEAGEQTALRVDDEVDASASRTQRAPPSYDPSWRDNYPGQPSDDSPRSSTSFLRPPEIASRPAASSSSRIGRRRHGRGRHSLSSVSDRRDDTHNNATNTWSMLQQPSSSQERELAPEDVWPQSQRGATWGGAPILFGSDHRRTQTVNPTSFRVYQPSALSMSVSANASNEDNSSFAPTDNSSPPLGENDTSDLSDFSTGSLPLSHASVEQYEESDPEGTPRAVSTPSSNL